MSIFWPFLSDFVHFFQKKIFRKNAILDHIRPFSTEIYRFSPFYGSWRARKLCIYLLETVAFLNPQSTMIFWSIWHFVLVQFRSCAIRSFVTISFFSISSLRQIVLSRTKLQERNCKKERTNLHKTSTKFKMLLHYLYPVIMLVKSINFSFRQLCHQ